MILTQKSKNSNQELYCKKCDYLAKRICDFKKHLQSKKHNTYYILTQKSYECVCGKKYKHKQSLYNHKKKCKIIENDKPKTELSKMDKKLSKMDNSQKCPKIHICQCGKSYKYQSGLSKHKRKCYIVNQPINQADIIEQKKYYDNKINKIETVLEQNQEIMKQVIEIAKEPKVINNNNTFNLNNFLTIDCKDAMNLSDFIDNYQFSNHDLEYVRDHGFIKYIQYKFIKKLSDMEQTLRPLHCTDKKRKKFFIKDNNKWEKQNNNHKLEKAIKDIRYKGLTKMTDDKTKNQDKFYNDDKYYDNYLYTTNNLLKKSDKDMDKIVHTLSSKMTIDR